MLAGQFQARQFLSLLPKPLQCHTPLLKKPAITDVVGADEEESASEPKELEPFSLLRPGAARPSLALRQKEQELATEKESNSEPAPIPVVVIDTAAAEEDEDGNQPEPEVKARGARGRPRMLRAPKAKAQAKEIVSPADEEAQESEEVGKFLPFVKMKLSALRASSLFAPYPHFLPFPYLHFLPFIECRLWGHTNIRILLISFKPNQSPPPQNQPRESSQRLPQPNQDPGRLPDHLPLSICLQQNLLHHSQDRRGDNVPRHLSLVGAQKKTLKQNLNRLQHVQAVRGKRERILLSLRSLPLSSPSKGKDERRRRRRNPRQRLKCLKRSQLW
ncbi:hypothetical protein CPB84DRAFT_1444952 [Gymnopilus junonius]|uniref:Uncharacterized protein n=1 Tax=Gymnopilus junonius TaxID=109634 RepID=A0A9P5TSQ6_GYMJU|nr:hypothetical protein CPB84DRAFT_1444952 [Gymnopilus junonius]